MKWLLLLLIALPMQAAAQTSHAVPPQCMPNAQGVIDYQACADVTTPGSDVRGWALINLGTQAILRQDYAAGVRFYDEATPPGKHLYSDAAFHALRADAYFHVGRKSEAFVDAHMAAAILLDQPDVPADIRARADRYGWDPELAYGSILVILKEARDPLYEPARAAFQALPEKDWQSIASRAAVFEQLGELDSAVSFSTRALAVQPENPAVLNNHCYILVRANRVPEALPYCKSAVERAPGIGGVQHSYASALAAAGRCGESREALMEARRLDPVSALYKQDIACVARR
ncbi:MAG: hypothetical protein FD124_3096 [Alphaproteobacteria bacterium]|nr:MAG: hypothetical protein FD160_2337 [Caulobacteraceae bacterium]TPW03255.1 MAG: hypothetical protein FD124_3096 [Alphaproteobacteria bacterium]